MGKKPLTGQWTINHQPVVGSVTTTHLVSQQGCKDGEGQVGYKPTEGFR